jgi:hypothetical protein
MKGAPDNPFDVREKFLACSKGVMASAQAKKFFRKAQELEKMNNIQELMEMIQ